MVTIDDVVRVNFNSTTTSLPESRTLATLEDLQTSSNGPIKLVSEDGTVTIEPGADNTFGVSADGTGNVLLEARGAGSDLIINAAVLSGSGQVTLNAGDDVAQNADVSTGGSRDDLCGRIQRHGGRRERDRHVGRDFNQQRRWQHPSGGGWRGRCAAGYGGCRYGRCVDCGGRDILDNNVSGTLASDVAANVATITLDDATGFAVGDMITLQDADSPAETREIISMVGNTLTLASGLNSAFDATTTQVSAVNARNVQAGALRLWADAVVNNDGTQDTTTAGNGVGQIGGADVLNGRPAVNLNAIDVQVTTLAAQSADGIYVIEADSLTVQQSGDIAISQVNANSTITVRTDASLADLVTSDNGPIKLVSWAGTLTVNDGIAGAINGNDGQGVSADGTGDVLLDARCGQRFDTERQRGQWNGADLGHGRP